MLFPFGEGGYVCTLERSINIDTHSFSDSNWLALWWVRSSIQKSSEVQAFTSRDKFGMKWSEIFPMLVPTHILVRLIWFICLYTGLGSEPLRMCCHV